MVSFANLKKIFVSIIFALGFFLPVFASAATGGIDASSNKSRLCSNADCTTYSTVYWRTTNGTAVSVSDSAVTGDIWSSDFGWINLNPTNGGVENTTGGVLSGYAWGQGSGWINFNPTNGGVTIDTNTGEFSGYAWVSGAGWMLFDCDLDPTACVKTDWRPVSTICTDTSATNYGGALPCTYSHAAPPPPPLLCLNPLALNYLGQLPCVYPTVCTDFTATNYLSSGTCVYTQTLCNDPSADNYKANASCIYGALCNDSAAINYKEKASCRYDSGICVDANATNYGGQLPCSYGEVCTDKAASNFGARENCAYLIPTLCTDATSLNYGAELPCRYKDTMTCGDSSAKNYQLSGVCVYENTTKEGTGGGECISSDATDVVGIIVGGVKTSFCEANKTVASTTKKIKDAFQSDEGDRTAKTITAVGIVASSVVSLSTILFINPLSFSELFLIPARLWSLLVSALGLKKRRRPWGTVYDSVTKQPLDPAYVTLKDRNGKEITSHITDLDGRFGFVVPEAGNYVLFVHKTNYVFPSQKLVGHDHDELYRDLYFGEYFTVSEPGSVIIKNIPMDPTTFDWNEFTKKQQGLMVFYSKRNKILWYIGDLFFNIGFVVASIAVLAAPKNYNIAIFLLYSILYFVRLHGTHSRPFGTMREKDTNLPLSFAVIRISNSIGVEIMHRIADAEGRYYVLLPNGEYKVRIDKKVKDGSYQTVMQDTPVTITEGYLAKEFLV